jgi:hypothetical protein
LSVPAWTGEDQQVAHALLVRPASGRPALARDDRVIADLAAPVLARCGVLPVLSVNRARPHGLGAGAVLAVGEVAGEPYRRRAVGPLEYEEAAAAERDMRSLRIG